MKRTFGLTLLFLGVLCVPTLLAQAAAVVTGGPPATTGAQETSEWGSAAIWAFLSTSALEWLKRNAWFTAVSDKTTWWTQRILGIVLAGATAVGIHFSFEWGAVPGDATIHLTGLTLASIAGAGGEALRQFCFNEMVYRAVVKNYGKA